MIAIDSHAHLDTFDEQGDLDGLLARARDAGVGHIVAIGGSPVANERACRLAAAYPEISATVGFDRDLAGTQLDFADAERLASKPGVVAIGETGLDYHYEPETRNEQIDLFTAMLDLAHRRTLPVVVHSREADADTLEVLAQHAARWTGRPEALGVLHCFTGNQSFADALLEIGYFISFSGILTFKNAGDLRDVAKALPLDRILIETDAPYLAPIPFRGKTNEPAYVIYVAEQLAELHQVSVEEVVQQTRRNCARLFFGTEDMKGIAE